MLISLLLLAAVFFVCLAWLAIGVVALHAVPSVFDEGRTAAVHRFLEKAPGLDLAITWFTAAPMLLGFLIAHAASRSLVVSALGFTAGWLAMCITSAAWCLWHERQHQEKITSSRIVSLLNAKVGRFRNHAALYATALAVPVFWVIRVAELVVYPLVVLLVRLPSYRHADFVNISRHKFDGLVGHDLIWCLYCDWMTGVWSLGSEMLRNVESFWCPIRFSSPEKCATCAQDFPDVDTSWVAADGTMQQVYDLLDDKLAAGNHSWHGHPSRLTIDGEPAPPIAPPSDPAATDDDHGPERFDGPAPTPSPAPSHGPVNDERELDAAADDLLRLDDDDRQQPRAD